MFIDSSLAAELIKLIKLRLMQLQLEFNVVFDYDKQCIKGRPGVTPRWGPTTQLHSRNCVFNCQSGRSPRRPPLETHTHQHTLIAMQRLWWES